MSASPTSFPWNVPIGTPSNLISPENGFEPGAKNPAGMENDLGTVKLVLVGCVWKMSKPFGTRASRSGTWTLCFASRLFSEKRRPEVRVQPAQKPWFRPWMVSSLPAAS